MRCKKRAYVSQTGGRGLHVPLVHTHPATPTPWHGLVAVWPSPGPSGHGGRERAWAEYLRAPSSSSHGSGAAPAIRRRRPGEGAHALSSLLLVYLFVSSLSDESFEADASDLVIISGIWFLVRRGEVNHGKRRRWKTTGPGNATRTAP